MKENLKLGFMLLIITAIAGFLLGGAYSITKEPIAKQAIKEKNEAMKLILPSADDFKVMEDAKVEGIVKEVNKGMSGDKIAGYAIKVAPKGYAGAVEMMVGISNEGKVTGIKILAHGETPGLGANATSDSFSGQYKNKPISPALVVVKGTASKENEIQAISGATITSRGVTTGVNEAIKFYTSNLKGGAK